jgi:hypothetical protein
MFGRAKQFDCFRESGGLYRQSYYDGTVEQLGLSENSRSRIWDFPALGFWT